MSRFLFLAAAMTVSAILVCPAKVSACPACADAIAASADLEEEDHFPKAMNESIYLMIGTPYLALGVFGVFVYRGCKKNAEFRKSLDASQSAG